jgi:hypothetical protein
MKTFLELRKINVNEHTEKKGRFTYLSWTWAVDQLLENDPSATWTFGDPTYFAETVMVYCTVTAMGKSMTCQMPVINNQNKAITNPNAMDVNTAMMRCLVKTIALFGIGLYIYAGEDLPQEDPIDQVTLEKWIKLIQGSMDGNELKIEYFNACKLAVNDPQALKQLEYAKNGRKMELGL